MQTMNYQSTSTYALSTPQPPPQTAHKRKLAWVQPAG